MKKLVFLITFGLAIAINLVASQPENREYPRQILTEEEKTRPVMQNFVAKNIASDAIEYVKANKLLKSDISKQIKTYLVTVYGQIDKNGLSTALVYAIYLLGFLKRKEIDDKKLNEYLNNIISTLIAYAQKTKRFSLDDQGLFSWGPGRFSENYTPLAMAAEEGLTDIMKQLIEAGASPDKEVTNINQFRTPLIYALMYKHADAAKLLLEQPKVNINYLSEDHNSFRTPLDWAEMNDMKEIKEILKERNAKHAYEVRQEMEKAKQ